MQNVDTRAEKATIHYALARMISEGGTEKT